jgi:hypothetical protein
MLSDKQRERLIQASAVGKEIKQGSHGELWERLTEETREKVLRRIAEVQWELALENPSAFTQEQITFLLDDKKKTERKELRKGLRFNYKTKKLERIK